MKGEPMITTSVRISPEFHKACRKHFISFTEALRRGIALMLAEKGVIEYDNDLNIVRLKNEYKRKAGAYAQMAANLKNEESQTGTDGLGAG